MTTHFPLRIFPIARKRRHKQTILGVAIAASCIASAKAIGPDADKLNVLFISIDPERDISAHLKEYLSSFDPRIRGKFVNSISLRTEDKFAIERLRQLAAL
jgi:hypothetical protein